MARGKVSINGLAKSKAEHPSESSSDSSTSTFVPEPWIEENITALECSKYIPARRSTLNSRCCCGLPLNAHAPSVRLDGVTRMGVDGFRSVISKRRAEGDGQRSAKAGPSERWQVKTHTREVPTNAYGTVEFQGGPHPTRARYVRLHYETSPETVLHLLLHEWRIRVPNLVISAIGGLAIAPLQSKLQRVVQSGLLKAAKTTGAWIITNGLDVGVTRHFGEALGDEVHVRGSNIVALGIAPWGYVQHRETLVGLDHTCAYYSHGWRPRHQEAPLHSHHNYFLLADNGTTGKFGAELCLRRRLEQYLAQQPIDMRRYGGSKSRVPIVAVLLEGGQQTFRTVFELITGRYPVPVVVCDGSGRAADLLAFMHRYANEEGDLPGPMKEQIISNISRNFQLHRPNAEGLYSELRLCMKRRHLISVFRMGEGDCNEIDIAILTALLQVSGRKLTPAEQLSLTMAWNRPDIARSKVFTSFSNWSTTTLENAMADALLNDRLEFVRLLIAKGVDIQRFLTVSRLEELYVAACDANNQSFHNLFAKVMGSRQRITLRSIGQLIEHLIGCGYQHSYCDKSGNGRIPSPEHEAFYYPNGRCESDPRLVSIVTKLLAESKSVISLSKSCAAIDSALATSVASQLITTQQANKVNANNTLLRLDQNCIFRYPYTELLQWALLTRRFNMAKFMVLAGEESIAKALFSVKLLRSIRHAVVDEESEIDLDNEFREQEKAFEQLAVELQDHCYRHDPDQAKRLLTYELRAFSNNTCLSLAYMCESKVFIGHVCTQSILNDLWYGGLRKGKLVGAKVAMLLIGMAFPPIYPFIAYCFSTRSKFLEFKTKEELARQPQTLQEHLDELEDSSSTSSSSSSSSSSDSSSDSSRPSSPKSSFDPTVAVAGGDCVRTASQCSTSDKYPMRLTEPKSQISAPNNPPGSKCPGTPLVAERIQTNRKVHPKRRKLGRRLRVKNFLLANDNLSSNPGGVEDRCEAVGVPISTVRAHAVGKGERERKRKFGLRLFSWKKSKEPSHPVECPMSGSSVCEMTELTSPHIPKDIACVHSVQNPSLVSTITHNIHPLPTVQDGNTVQVCMQNCEMKELTQRTQSPRREMRLRSVDPPRYSACVTCGPQRTVSAAPLAPHRLRTGLHAAPNASSSTRGSNMATTTNKHNVLLRSNLAALLPSNHYASVAAKGKFRSSRRPANSVLSGKACTIGISDDTKPHSSFVGLSQHRNHTSWKGVPTTGKYTTPDMATSFANHAASHMPFVSSKGSYFDYPSAVSSSRPLSWRKRIYEFFSAPVTRFYLHVILYLVFLVLYIGLCIHTIPREKWSLLELYVYLHIVTYFLDKFREIKFTKGTNCFQKLCIHLTAFWNVYDTGMCTVSIVGIILRYVGMVESSVYMWGKNLLIICCAVWQMRFLELLQIWRFSGPYVYMVLMMLRVMVPMLGLLLLPLVAFGTLREGIMYPNRTEVTLDGIKGILLKPYFMLYGEVYAGEIDPVDFPVESINAPLREAVPISMVIYLLYSIILFISVIIATFNDIFSRVLKQSVLIYNYLRYAVIIEYESRPLLPPPFIIISWLYMLFCYLHRLRKKRRFCFSGVRPTPDKTNDGSKSRLADLNQSNEPSPRHHSDDQHGWTHGPQSTSVVSTETSVGLKLFLSPDEVEKLHDFEEECVDDYWREMRKQERLQAERHENVISRKLDHLQFRVGEIHLHQNHLRRVTFLMEDHMRFLEESILRQAIHVNEPDPKIQKEKLLIESLLLLVNSRLTEKYEGPDVATSDGSDLPHMEQKPTVNADQLRNNLNAYLNHLTFLTDDNQQSPVFAQVVAGTKNDANRERSPSPNRGLKHKSSRLDYRFVPPNVGISIFGTSLGSDSRNQSGRPRTTSHRLQDCAYREYTTICDDIDISCLSSSDSSTTTPIGSQTNLTILGLPQSSGSRQLEMINSGRPSFNPQIRISEAPSPVVLSQDEEYMENVDVDNEGSVDQRGHRLCAVRLGISTSSLDMNHTASTGSIAHCHSAPNYERNLRLGALTMSASSPVIMQNSDTVNLHPISTVPTSSGKNEGRKSRLSKRYAPEHRRDLLNISDSSRTGCIGRIMSDRCDRVASSDAEPVSDLSEDGSGLQQAERAERAQLRGVLIRRLRKLSIASNSAKPTSSSQDPLYSKSSSSKFQPNTPQQTQILHRRKLPDSTLSFDFVDRSDASTRSDDNRSSNEESGNRRSQVLSNQSGNHPQTDAEYSGRSASPDAIAFGPADVGDFLSHIAQDEGAVDPDLDLDLYSLETRASSLRWSTDSQAPAVVVDPVHHSSCSHLESNEDFAKPN